MEMDVSRPSPALAQRFEIVAMADPQALPRILNYFTQRWLVPERVAMRREDTLLHIDIQIHLDADAADLIAAKLRETVLVLDAAVSAPVPA